MSASAPAASVRGGDRARLRIRTVGILIVAAAIAGSLLGGVFATGPATAPRLAAAQPIAHEGLRLVLPSGWARGDAAILPGFSRPLRLRQEDEALQANVERLSASSATLLPAAFVK